MDDRHITLAKLSQASKAIVFGKRVDREIQNERFKICNTCEWKRTDKYKHIFCGLCGCNVSSSNNRIINLTAYEEKLPHYGCKHPQRKDGKGWLK